MEITHCKDYKEMSEKASQLVFEGVSSAKKQFSMALSGGNSVKGILQKLAEKNADWAHVNAFMADERLVPLESPESNFRQANELFFSKARGIHVHRFDPEKGVQDYSKKFMAVTRGKLDLLVLGVGEDGHIASLFPNHEALDNVGEAYVEVLGAPKLPAKRISLGVEAMQNAGTVVLLFASESKKRVFRAFTAETGGFRGCPARAIRENASVFVYTAFGEAENAE